MKVIKPYYWQDLFVQTYKFQNSVKDGKFLEQLSNCWVKNYRTVTHLLLKSEYRCKNSDSYFYKFETCCGKTQRS